MNPLRARLTPKLASGDRNLRGARGNARAQRFNNANLDGARPNRCAQRARSPRGHIHKASNSLSFPSVVRICHWNLHFGESGTTSNDGTRCPKSKAQSSNLHSPRHAARPASTTVSMIQSLMYSPRHTASGDPVRASPCYHDSAEPAGTQALHFIS